MKKTFLLVSSPHFPVALEAYLSNARDYGHRDLEVLLIGDRNCGPEVNSFSRNIERNFFPCHFLDMDSQKSYLNSRNNDLKKHLRFDSRPRKSIGLLWAWENGADLVLFINPQDDPIKGDFVGQHLHVGDTSQLQTVSSPTGWANPYAALEESNGLIPYPRGFPLSQRSTPQDLQFDSSSLPVAANFGTCFGRSDLDAIAYRNSEVHISPQKRETDSQLCLAPGTWSPFPAHNLAIKRDLIPAYFLSPYVGRSDDVWASFLVSRIAQHLGEGITFGSPGALRNGKNENLQKDLELELVGYRQTSRFCQALRSIQLTSTSYHDCFGEIAAALQSAWPEPLKASGIEIEARSQILNGTRLWHETFANLQAQSRTNLFKNICPYMVQPAQVPALAQRP
jgi:hypothetical protein